MEFLLSVDLQPQMTVNLISAEDATTSVLDATHSLCRRVVSGDLKMSHIDVDLVDNVIQGKAKCYPEVWMLLHVIF